MGDAGDLDEPTMADTPGDLTAMPPPHGPPPHRLDIPSEPTIADEPGGVGVESTVATGEPAPRRPREFPVIPGYLIESELGRGGMGVVYKARRVRLNRIVAIKMILAGEHAGPEASVRFLAEAEVIARVQHPNIVQIFHIDEHGGLPYFEMEFLGGGSLADRLDGQPRPPRVAASLVVKLARGVAAAHLAGVVHRDIKPGNILLANDGTPKVADFGLAKSLAASSGLTRTDSILGSPSYMAPEQAEGKAREVGPTADVYALGAILYEQLTGRPPFVGATVLDTLHQVKSSEPVSPSRLVPGLPRDVETIVRKCLEKSPGRRYATAADLADDLERFLSGSPIVARPVPFWERGWKWAARRPSVALLGLALVATAATAMALGVVSYGEIQDALGDARDEHARAVLARAEESTARQRAEAARVAADAARDAAMAETYRASISEARALRASHLPGWRDAALGNLARLAVLPTSRRDLVELRSEVVACLGEFDIREVARFQAPQGSAFGLDFLADGRTLASAHRNGSVQLWDVDRPASIGVVSASANSSRAWGAPEPNEPWPTVRRRPDGRGLFVNGRGLGLGSVEGPDLLRAPRPSVRAGSSESCAIAPDATGRRVAVGFLDGRVEVLDVETTARIAVDRAEAPRAFAIRGDGRQIAVAGPNATVRLRSLDGPSLPFVIGRHRTRVAALAYSPDGTTLATASDDGAIVLWDLARREWLFSLVGHKGRVNALTFSADGEWIATASDDHTVRLWEARGGRELAVLEQPSFVMAVAFSPDGGSLATACIFDDSIRLYRIKGRSERLRLRGHTAGVERVAFHPRLDRLASGDVTGRIILWDAADGRPLRVWKAQNGYIGALGFSPDGSILASGGGRGGESFRLWNPLSGSALRGFSGHQSFPTALTFDGPGRRIATADVSGYIRVWDVATGASVRPPSSISAQIHALAFVDDDRRLLVQAYQGPTWLLDAAGIEPPRSVATVGGGAVLAVDPARVRAVVGGATGDLTAVSLPDLTPGLRVEGLHVGPIHKLVLSPDRTTLASGGEDRRVVLSDAATLRPLVRFPPRFGRVKSLAFDATGTRLAVSGIDSDIAVWDLRRVHDVMAEVGLAWDRAAPASGGETGSLSPFGETATPTIRATAIDPGEFKTARALVDSARAARREGRTAEAITDLREAVTRSRRVARANLDDAEPATWLAFSLRLLADGVETTGHRDEARSAMDDSRDILERNPAPTPVALYDLGCTYARLFELTRPGSTSPTGLDRETLAHRAVDALRRAGKIGLRGQDNPATDLTFGPLHDRVDFRNLLLDLAFPGDPFAPGKP